MYMAMVRRIDALMVKILLLSASFALALDVPMSSIRHKVTADFSAKHLQSRPESMLGERLHVLHHAGDVESVAALFCEMIGANISSSNNNNSYNDSATIDRSHYFLNDRYYYNIGLSSLLTLNQVSVARNILNEILSTSAKIYPDTVHMFIRDAFKRGQ